MLSNLPFVYYYSILRALPVVCCHRGETMLITTHAMPFYPIFLILFSIFSMLRQESSSDDSNFQLYEKLSFSYPSLLQPLLHERDTVSCSSLMNSL